MQVKTEGSTCVGFCVRKNVSRFLRLLPALHMRQSENVSNQARILCQNGPFQPRISSILLTFQKAKKSRQVQALQITCIASSRTFFCKYRKAAVYCAERIILENVSIFTLAIRAYATCLILPRFLPIQSIPAGDSPALQQRRGSRRHNGARQCHRRTYRSWRRRYRQLSGGVHTMP